MMKEMLAYLKEFQEALYIYVDEAYRLFKHIAIINNGSLEAFAPKQELFRTGFIKHS